jgi:preprotein translocase subunit SecD
LALLYPTYRASNLEDKRDEYVKKANDAPTSADSLTIMEEFQEKHGEDYTNAKDNSLKLGLDLRGGMYVTLEVDVIKLIEESAFNEAKDDIFNQVIEATKAEIQESEESVIDLFVAKFNEIARPQGKSLLSYFDVKDFKDVSEEKIVERLEDNADDAIDQALEVIRQRIDQFGVSEPNIQKQGNRRILLELPGVQDEAQMRNLLQTTARLEFHLVRNNATIARSFKRIDEFLYNQSLRKAGQEPEPEATTVEDIVTGENDTLKAGEVDIDEKQDVVEEDTQDTSNVAANADTSASDTTSEPEKSQEELQEEYFEKHPFTSLFATYFAPNKEASGQPVSYDIKEFPDGLYTFWINGDQLDRFNEILSRPSIKAMIPAEYKISIHAKPDPRTLSESNVELYSIYSLKSEPELTGEVITDAMQSFDQTTNAPMVVMEMNSTGADQWSRITGANVGKQIAIVLDNRVYSAPNVIDRITGGVSQITGMSNNEEARLLEIVLKAGALKAPVQIIEERVVGPSLGQDSIDAGFTASMVAFGLVILYMLVYYNRGGAVADFAVLLNVTLIISLLAALKGTLTLPGIAGIILTIGMAVDANVLIFERIREELRKGRSLKSAVDEGYSKALSAIIDSNITTGITALILNFLGSGPIQGFAITLLIGIMCTLFTAILITRAIIEIMISNGATEMSFGQPKIVEAK